MIWTLPGELTMGNEDAAIALVNGYYAENDGRVSYSGARFDVLDGGGDREEVRDHFTYADLLSTGLLSTPLKRHSVLTMLGEHLPHLHARAQRLLEQLPTRTDLKNADDSTLAVADELRQTLLKMPGIGPVIASKLMARKRPRLIPIIDSVVTETLHHPGDNQFWARLREYLRTDDLHERLLKIGDESAAPDGTSAIRIFDVIVWMHGKKRTDSP